MPNEVPIGTRSRIAATVAAAALTAGPLVARRAEPDVLAGLGAVAAFTGAALTTVALLEVARRVPRRLGLSEAAVAPLEAGLLAAVSLLPEPLHTLRGARVYGTVVLATVAGWGAFALTRGRPRLSAVLTIAAGSVALATHLTVNSAMYGALHAGACAFALLCVASLAERARPSRTLSSGALLALAACGLLACELAVRSAAVRARLHELGPTMRAAGALLVHASDVDGDGTGVWFGASDCAPLDGRRGPFEPDAPGDGVDSDCDGVDPRPLGPVAAAPAAPASDDRRNVPDVLVLSIDAVRADAAGHLDDLRRVLGAPFEFTRAVAPASRTLNSFGAMLRGRTYDRVPFDHRTLGGGVGPGAPPTLGHVLGRHGVRAGFVSTHAYIAPSTGVIDGFESLRRPEMPYDDPGRAGPDTVLGAEDAIALLTEAARTTPGPLFVATHFMEAHEPYRRLDGTRFTDDRAGYLQAIDGLDARLAGFVESFAAIRGRAPIVVVLSDHGEAFGDHGNRRHASSVHAEQVLVPLLLAVPGRVGRRVDAPVSTAALPATLLELLGLPPEPSFELRSLVPCATTGQACPQVAVSALHVLARPTDAARRGYTTATHRVLIDRAHDLSATYGPDDPGELRPRRGTMRDGMRQLESLDDGRR